MFKSPRHIYLQFQTPHYKFEMKVTEEKEPMQRFIFIVGNKNKPCLEGIITLENTSKNNRLNLYENTAALHKLDALEECSLEDITNEYMTKHSFGKEMLDSVVFFINHQFESIQSVSLTDTSFIPCNRSEEDTLDLLSYSIALYKKTWYEERLDAYTLPKENFEAYRKQVDIYGSKETKQQMPFEEMYLLIKSEFARSIIDTNIEFYRNLFNASETLPDFFKGVNKSLKREDKCRFFKQWLLGFISSRIQFDRTWYFDLYPKIKVIKSLTNKTRRNNKKSPQVEKTYK